MVMDHSDSERERKPVATTWATFRLSARVLLYALLHKNCLCSTFGLDYWKLWSIGQKKKGRKEMFYLMTHSTHFIYGYMASDIW